MALGTSSRTVAVGVLSLLGGAFAALLWYSNAPTMSSTDEKKEPSRVEDSENDTSWEDPLLEELLDEAPESLVSAREALGEDLARHFESFFESPRKDAYGHFSRESQPVRWDASCASLQAESPFEDLSHHVEVTYGFVSVMFPQVDRGAPRADDGRPIQVMNMNLYYVSQNEGGETLYNQLSLVLGSDPALGTGYRVERYQSADPFLDNILDNSILAPDSRRFDLSFSEGKTIIEESVSRWPPGFQMGTRSLVYGPLADGKQALPSVSIELTGGRVTSFSEERLSCEGFTNQTQCSCLELLDSSFDFASP